MPFQTGDTGLASAINHYFLFVSFGLVGPLIMGYLLFLRGFGLIGLLWTSQGSTLLPPLVNLLPVVGVIILATLIFSTFDPSILPSLLVMHIIGLATTVVLVLLPTWNLYFSCLNGQIACTGGWDYIVYGMALVFSIILTIALVLTLLSIVDYWRRISARDSMVTYNVQRYQELTGSTLVVEDADVPESSSAIGSGARFSSSSSSTAHNKKKGGASRRQFTSRGMRPMPQ